MDSPLTTNRTNSVCQHAIRFPAVDVYFDESSCDSGYGEEPSAFSLEDSPGNNRFTSFSNFNLCSDVDNHQKSCTANKFIHNTSGAETALSKTPMQKTWDRVYSVPERTKRTYATNHEETTPTSKRHKRNEDSFPLEIRKGEKSLFVRDHIRESHIQSVLDRVSYDSGLIGDGSSTHCLPTVPGKHQDLKSITPETLAEVINHEYDNIIENFVIVDCRYPYEYEGGHIEGAKNYYTEDAIMENLVNSPLTKVDSNKRNVIILHCEFSSQRGPKLCRFLRSMDRDQNRHRYPFLFYPEVYILQGGYKEFFFKQKELCSPQNYVPMLVDGYKKDMRKFRIKSKSWAGETQRPSLRRGLKF